VEREWGGEGSGERIGGRGEGNGEEE
jgi:hypothetical protein